MQEVFALPLSFGQRRLWFLDQLEPGCPFYNVPSAVRLSGALDVPALAESLRRVIDRHEILRTTFTQIADEAVQVVVPAMPFDLPAIDLRDIPETAREEFARQVAVEKILAPFDLEAGPLLRAVLLQLGAREHVLLLVMHHIISDGWSVDILLREIASLYDAALRGVRSPLPDLPVQYADFAVWQRNWLQGEVVDRQLDYWKQQLVAPPIFELPTDRPRPPVQTYGGATEYLVLSEALSQSLKRLAKQEGATLFMTLLTAFNVLLYRYTGQQDIIIGTAVTNRNRAELQSLIGFFVNTLAIRTDMSGDPGFGTLLRRVKQTVADAFANQDLPFEMLVDELQLARDISRTPLFQMMFTLETAPQNRVEVAGLELSEFTIPGQTAIFDMLFQMADHGPHLSGALHYNTDLFNRDTVRRMLRSFQQLLGALVAAPGQPISLVPLLSSHDLRQLLDEFNDTRSDYPQDLRIEDLFDAQVKRTPDAIALTFGQDSLTYSELSARANQTAHYLARFGAGPERLVAICLERSIEMVVGLLGVIKSGAAYVPMDPAYPKERLSFMLADTEAAIILTQERVRGRLPEHDARMICLDADWQTIARESTERPEVNATAGNMAYIIYTSGSTGRPKGVVIEHHSAATLLYWARDRFDAQALSNVLASTSICFDLSVFELFVPLSWGGTITLVDNILGLAELASGRELTLINTVPSALQELLRMGAVPPCVRVVNLAGEALPQRLVERFYESGIAADVFNLYGPSEDTTYSTWALIKKPVTATPPIGRPIANTQIYLLDGRAQPVPLGATAEGYIGGEGLARGYWNRPDLTAEKFLPDPFTSQPGGRLYRTGDLLRYLDDGQIEFVGRIDHQIKIRGHRIELGEIEETLRQHAGVEATAVVALGESGDTKQLVAYVVPRIQPPPTAAELRSHLKQTLPDFMLPAAFVGLERMPMTPNGKIDRRALPAPDPAERPAPAAYVPPRTPTEEMLTGIFGDVLGRAPIGTRDDFFDLGGHSLLATRITSWVRNVFPIELPLRDLFESPTVAALSAKIDQRIREGGGLPASPMMPVSRAGDLPLSFAQQRLWFVSQLAPETLAYNLDTVVHLSGALNITAIERSLNEIVERHESLRTTFHLVDGQPVQAIAPSATLKLHLVDLTAVADGERDDVAQRLIKTEVARPFDLMKGPLLRVTLLRLGERDHLATFTMHHIISDGWSMGILIREISALYEAFSSGQPSPLRPLPIQYADFAVWQRQSLQGEALERQLAYWKQVLGDEPPVMQLPTDHPRPAVQTYNGSRESFVWPQDVSAALQQMSRREGATLFMTLLAIFQVLLKRYAGEEVIVGADIANRNRAETEGLIGFFVNMMVLRADLSGDPSFREFLGRVRETALGAYAHQDLPFEYLVDALQPVRDRSRNPLFQVVFVLQNAPMTDLHLPGLSLKLLESANSTAKFDLTLSITEAAGQLFAWLEYNTDLFERETITRLISHFSNLAGGAIAYPDSPISALPLLSDAEVHHLLAECNIRPTRRPGPNTIHELFEAQAEATPDAIALVYEDRTVSYATLNRRANQLAHFLRSLGVGPDVCVGIGVERSPDMIVALLGILKAGGAYAPLDLSCPLERLAFMIEDIGAPVVLTEQRLADDIPAGWAQVVCMDSDWPLIAEQSPDNDGPSVDADNLAYVMYTSGSTGTPKGVCITHAGVVRLVRQGGYAELTAAERFLQFAPISFDASTFEIWGSLLNGAQLVIPAQRLSLDGLGRVIEDHQITTLWLTAALFQTVVETQMASLRSVRQLLAGGDVLPLPQVRKVLEGLGDCQLINGYGPTENTTFTCCYQVNDAARLEFSVPIGRPIANTSVYILDHRLQPVPPGVYGDLYTGGEGLARCYHNWPKITAEKFIPNPFNAEPSARLYRTGDVARRLPSGDIEFLGRLDQQVKLRGFRIELGEVEAALAAHPAIEKALAIVREDDPGDKRLVAYLVRKSGGAISQAEWRDFLKSKLPEYMLPSAFVELEGLPYTANGKIDRRALPAPDASPHNLSPTYTAPRNSTEALLAEIWGEVLRLESVGVCDNFFDLGGDSLLSVQLCAKAQKAGLQIRMHDLFEHQTIERLAAAIAPLSAGASLPRLSAFDLITEADRAKLPADIEDAYPLVLLQVGMLFHSEYSPHSALYHDVISFHLQGRFDRPALQQAVERLVQQNEMLRTSFDLSTYGEPLQLVHRAATLEVEEEDLRGLSEAQQEQLIVAGIEAEKGRKYDWQKPPLMRLTVSLRDHSRFQLRVSFHHAILDGWSVALMLRALFDDYVKIVAGEAPEHRPAPAKYREYVARERETLQSGESLGYWQAKLRNAEAGKFWQWRPDSGSSEQVKVESRILSQEVTTGLRRVAATEGIGLKSVLLAAHLRVLRMISGDAEVVTGLVMHGRPESEGGEAILGLFLNTLPLRVRVAGGSWRELARAAHEQEKEMLPHRWYPMAQLQRQAGGAPLFHTLFNFLHFHVFQGVVGHTGIDVIETLSSTETNFMLTSTFQQNPASDELEFRLGYDATKISAEQAEAIIGYYQSSLEAISRDAEAPYHQTSLLSASEREQLLRASSPPPSAPWTPTCLHERFAQQARQRPEAVAVISGGQRLGYAALHARSNQLARRLQRMGVGVETRVGLALERGIDMVVGLLAVLKAGGVYVPMEMTDPPERLRYIAADAAVQVVLSETGIADRLGGGGWQELQLDEQGDAVAAESETDVENHVTAENLAYIIYTSGSTGLPKGVLVTHRSVDNHLQWRQSAYPLNETDRFLQKAPLGFDISAWEIFGTLLAGASLVLARPGGQKDAAYLINEIGEQRVTVAHFGPAMLEMMLQEDGLADCQSLRRVFCGGEPLSAQSRDRFFERLAASLHIQYGPTETTIDVTAYDCEGTEPGGTLPIGKPIANTQIYILDHHGQLAPTGVAGELYVAGDCLARGYLHLPDLTAERFLPDPFAGLPGSRLYRTGDRARVLPDGNIEFIGRTDDQIKIRGFRVELGEIEAALRQHPDVEEAVVVARGDLADKRLVAYLVTRSHQLPAVAERRARLREQLPDYMLPSDFVLLEALPLTPNGKVDRRALPAPDQTRPASESQPVPPRDPWEAQLVAIWESLLGVKPVGIRDDFFDLGGHSLIAIRLMAKLQQAFGKRLPLKVLFQAPTVEQLAQRLKQEAGDGQHSPLVRIQGGGREPAFFFAHPVGGNVLCYVELARLLGADQPVYAFQAQGGDGRQPVPYRIEEMAAHYIAAMRSVQPHGPYRLGGWSMGGVIAFEMARQLEGEGERVARLVLIDSRPPRPGKGENDFDEISLLIGFARDLGLVIEDAADLPEALRLAATQTRLSFVMQQAQAANLLPGDLDLDHLGCLFDVFKRNLQAASEYAPPPSPVPLSLVLAREGGDALHARQIHGWENLTRGGVEIQIIPGDHYGLLKQPNVAVLAARLKAGFEGSARSAF